MAKSPLRIFLSHTSELRELPADRSFVGAAEAAVIRAGHAVSDMAYFTARDAAPADYCTGEVAGAQVYVGIIGMRYGAPVRGRADLSHTELEFETATRLGLPRLLFLLPDRALPRPPAAEADGGTARQEAFRRRLLDESGVTVTWVSSPAELELALLHALVQLDARPEATAVAMRTLPRDVATFTGRDEELRRLLGTLSRTAGSGSVVTISAIDGMAGVGKTAFAVHAAHRLSPQFPDGQLFLDLHAHTAGQGPVTPAGALRSLLLITGVAARQIPADLGARVAMWRARLAGRRMLIVLDDAAGHEQVRPLLPGAPGCLVLITSRRRLAALEDAEPLTLGTLPPAQAAELFTRLLACRDEPAGSAQVMELMELCGHLPLAIGLLAGRLRSRPAWSVRHLAQRLEDAHDRLAEIRAENVAVDAAFELSYRGLPGDQQRLFCRLGLLPGRDVDAYAAAALGGVDLAQARRLLDALYNGHLVDEPVAGRYRLHELIREYARTLASRVDAAANGAARDRLLDYYLHTTAIAGRQIPWRDRRAVPSIAQIPAEIPELSSPRGAMDWLEAERANLAACLDHAAGDVWPVRALGLVHAMYPYLRFAGHWDQALASLGTAATVARLAGDRLAQADALDGLGSMRCVVGEYAAADADLTEAMTLYGELGHEPGRASVLVNRGIAQRLTGRYRASRDSLVEAVSLYRGLDDRLGQANALNELGIVHNLTDESGAASASLREALLLYRDLGHRLGQANVLIQAGILEHVCCDYQAATASLSEALALYRELDDRLGQAAALSELGRVRQLAGEHESASAVQTEALALFRDLGSRHGAASSLTRLGADQSMTGDYRAASASLSEALTLYRELGSPLGRANVLTRLGSVQWLVGEQVTGCASLVEAVSLYRELGDRLGEATALNVLGARLLDASAVGDALHRHRMALRLARDIGSPLEEARALEGIGRCRLRGGQAADGRDQLQRALAIYRRIGTHEAGQVVATLVELRPHTEPQLSRPADSRTDRARPGGRRR